MSDTRILLPLVVEELIITVQVRHEQNVDHVARVYLRKAGEDNAVQLLSSINSTKFVRNLSALIVDKAKKYWECPSPLPPCGERPSAPGENPASPPGNGVNEESPVAKPGPGISDGLSDNALLAIDIDRGLRTLPEGNATPPGSCKSWGEGPTSASLHLPLAASQGSNDSAECGNHGAPLPRPLPCNLERTPKPEPDAVVGTPSSEPRSSPKKRSSGSTDDGSSGSRNVKTKQTEQTLLVDHFKHRNSSAAALPCKFGEARKLEFGPEPSFPPSDPQSSQIVDPRPEHVNQECKFRHKECALMQRPELADPQVARAFGRLSFTKRFLILDHCKGSQEFPPVKELEALQSLEVKEVDNRLYHRSSRPDHIAMRDWSKLRNGHLVFTCTVDHFGKRDFSGPRFENGGTPLERAFGQENILVVKFEDTANDHHLILNRYRCLAMHGIMCSLKKFVFYAFKDAESKKKQGLSKNSTYGCKCVLLAIDSCASADTEENIKKFKSIGEARSFIMHPTVPSLAKAVSRTRLALSQTTQVPLDFDKIHVQEIPDILCKDEKDNIVYDANGKPLIHTDGNGCISKNLAILCQGIVIKGIKRPEKVNPNQKQEYPLMVQIRLFWKGNLYKGVLVVDLKLLDNTIQVRPSMLKVKKDDKLPSATFNSLELCNTSRAPSDARLFQHLILLLKLGGVEEEVLLKYVETAIEKLRTYFTKTEEAMKVVVKNKDSHQSGEIAIKMLASGIEPGKEPYLQKILLEMVKSKVQNYALGKVHVPQAVYLMGCADPTGLLERNQVAILNGNGSRICREKVLVYKPPGLHRGDVHVFEATWVRQLESHFGTGTYGIVFSVKGARSVTDEMAGSDLDGDQYWVTWNSELVDSFNPSPPWEAPNVKDPEPSLRPTDEEEFENKHFSKFLEARFQPSTIKGMSANSWVALTDCTMSRNVDKEYQILAQEHIPTVMNLFYESLDADKSGKEVRWSSHLSPSVYPHFLEKNKDEAAHDYSKLRSGLKRISACGRKPPAKKYEVYKSTSILGRIYDMVKDEDFHKQLNVELDVMFLYDGFEDYHELWRCEFKKYNQRMSKHLQKVDEPNAKRCGSDKILADYKKRFLGEGKSEEQLLKEASAIYSVVYTKSLDKDRQTLQFAWKIAGPELCKIYAKNQGDYMCMSMKNVNFFLKC